MQKITVLLSLLGVLTLTAQEQESAPQLKGVLLVDDVAKVRATPLDPVQGIQCDGVDTTQSNLNSELTSFLSDFSLTASGVKMLCEAIETHYREHQDLRMTVSVPEQNMEDGVVQLVVAQERLGEVHVKDNRYTHPQTLTKWVRLSKQEPINEKTLAQDVGWMNTNPYRSVHVAYQPSERTGTTHVDLVVSDKKNWKLLSGVDNLGTNPIGPLRIFAGVNVNNFIFTDHTLNLQAAASDHYSEYQAYEGQYVIPLPWRNTLRLFGNYKATSPHRTAFPQRHRQTYQASGRYAVPHWFGANPWIDQITFEAGADFKGTNTNVLDEGNPQPAEKKLAYIGQFVGSVNAQRTCESNKITAGLDVIGSPAEMLPNQTDADFNNLRLGATPQYLYSRLALALDQTFAEDWNLFLQGRAQFSLSNLLPSEQFALGGYMTVRGYEERAVNGDNAICGNLEIKTPALPIVGLWYPKFGDSLYLLGFVDAGYAWFRQAVPNVPLNQSLLGVGPGLRYKISSYFSSRLDVGFPLLQLADEAQTPHVHFNAVLSY